MRDEDRKKYLQLKGEATPKQRAQLKAALREIADTAKREAAAPKTEPRKLDWSKAGSRGRGALAGHITDTGTDRFQGQRTSPPPGFAFTANARGMAPAGKTAANADAKEAPDRDDDKAAKQGAEAHSGKPDRSEAVSRGQGQPGVRKKDGETSPFPGQHTYLPPRFVLSASTSGTVRGGKMAASPAVKAAPSPGDDKAVEASLASLKDNPAAVADGANKNPVATGTGNAIAANAKTLDEKGRAGFVAASFAALRDVANNSSMSDADKTASAQRILEGLGAVIPDAAPKDRNSRDATTGDIAQRLDCLTDAKKKLIYPTLANALTGAQLARLTEANPKLAQGVKDGGYTSEPSTFMKAIQDAPEKTRTGYVNALRDGYGLEEPKTANRCAYIDTAAIGTALLTVEGKHNNVAEAAGQVLVTLQGVAFTDATQGMTLAQVKAIVQNAVHEGFCMSNKVGRSRVLIMDARLAAHIAGNAATSQDPEVQAYFFQAGPGFTETCKARTGLLCAPRLQSWLRIQGLSRLYGNWIPA